MQILVIDDEPLNVEVMRALLEDQGHLVDSANGGREGLKLVLDRSALVKAGLGEMYKLILLDYSMPDLDGPQVAKAIRAHFEDNGLLDLRPYICCVSAYTEASFK